MIVWKFLFCWLCCLIPTLHGFFFNETYTDFLEVERRYDINETIDGKELRKITDCPSHRINALCPNQVHIIIISSESHYNRTKGTNFLFQKETIEYYAKVRGYIIRIVDPELVFKRYPNIKPDCLSCGKVIASKSLLMKCKCYLLLTILLQY